MTKQRLAKLERAVKDFCARPCALCWGEPIAAVELEEDPDGPGFRRRPWKLHEEDRRRVTDDFRCRRCGKAARVTLLVTTFDVPDEEQICPNAATSGSGRCLGGNQPRPPTGI